MITRFFAADDGVRYDADLPVDVADDLAATVDRVRGWGGSARAYRHFLARALAVAATTDADVVRTAAVLAGWRAGVLRLRTDALARARDVADPVTEAALGLSPGSGSAFLTAQESDPFAHPAAGPLIGIVGGFRGLGGPWLHVPSDAVVTGATSVSVRSGEDRWLVTADVFAATITPTADPPRAAAGLCHARVGASYHVWLMRGTL